MIAQRRRPRVFRTDGYDEWTHSALYDDSTLKAE